MSISAITSTASQFTGLAAKAKITASSASFAEALSNANATTETSSASKTSSIATAPVKTNSAVDAFKDYMKMSPAERMEEAWLKRHGLTKEDLAAMSPEEQAAIRDQMAKELKAEAEQTAKEGRKNVDLLA